MITVSKSKFIYVAAVAVIFAAAAASLIIKKYQTPAYVAFEQIGGTAKETISLPGRIYLSLMPTDNTLPPGIYSYDLSRESLVRILVGENRKTKDYPIQISPSFSEDGTLMAFARRKKNESAFQIYVARPDGTGLKQITATAETGKREPVLSPSKELVAYIASVNTNISSSTIAGLPENYGVYIADFSGKTAKVTNGTNPLFSSDGRKLLVLKNDGLHLFDISDIGKPKHIKLVMKIGNASQDMKFALSHDRMQLAQSFPDKREVIVSKIYSWENFSLATYKIISAEASWPAFSPDGKFLAVQEVRSPSRRGKYAVLAVYSLTDSISADLLSLYNYKNTSMWLGGWIER